MCIACVYFMSLREISLLGLFVIAVGTGGIKPCVSAFGGDQFVRPQQDLQLEQFFSVFYFSINAGSLLSTFLTPYLRSTVHCFGDQSCYPLAFGVPAVLFIVALGKTFRFKNQSNLHVPVVSTILLDQSCSSWANRSTKSVLLREILWWISPSV